MKKKKDKSTIQNDVKQCFPVRERSVIKAAFIGF